MTFGMGLARLVCSLIEFKANFIVNFLSVASAVDTPPPAYRAPDDVCSHIGSVDSPLAPSLASSGSMFPKLEAFRG